LPLRCTINSTITSLVIVIASTTVLVAVVTVVVLLLLMLLLLLLQLRFLASVPHQVQQASAWYHMRHPLNIHFLLTCNTCSKQEIISDSSAQYLSHVRSV
jgi:hypothetical protein